MSVATRVLWIAGIFAVLGVLGLGPAQAASDVELTITQDGQPVVGAQIEIFLSNDHMIAQTDDLGQVVFEVESGKGFWLEVDDERLAEFYFVADAPMSIDLADVDTIEWGGR